MRSHFRFRTGTWRRSWSTAPDATIAWPEPPQLLELHLPVGYSEFLTFALIIDKVDHGRVMTLLQPGYLDAITVTSNETLQNLYDMAGTEGQPLLRDIPGIKRLTFNGSYRWTDYESYGSDSTYKVSLNWQFIDALRLRGAYGTSFRAPALFELYLANQTGFIGQG